MGRLFGTDGIRGIVNEELDCELALRVGIALGKMVSGEVLVGMDTRASSDMLAAAVAAGVASAGRDVKIIGVCSTPAVAYLVRQRAAGAGVMISASHNPYEYNGIKIFSYDGYKLPDSIENEIEKLVLSGTNVLSRDRAVGRIESISDEKEKYLDFLSGAFGVALDGMKIAVDCANGSTVDIAGRLFTRLGAKCHVIGNTPDGKNINDRCGSTSLERLKDTVRRGEFDAGVAFDGDGDRCLAVDERGCEVDGDYIMAILALWKQSEGTLAKNTLVGTVMTNLGLRKFCEKNGITFKASAVGDRYVSDMMREEGYCFGGEQSGHIIFGDIATTGDGLLTATALLSHIKRSGGRLSELSRVMKKYPQIIVNIHADKEKKARLDTKEARAIIKDAEERLGSSGRILVRPSGTEPLIRIMAEAETEALAREVAEEVAKKINGVLG